MGYQPYLFAALDRCSRDRGKGFQMLGLLLVIAIALLLFGVIGGIAVSKFLFLLLVVAGVIFLIGLLTRSTA
jgi:hypothetical protein